MVQDGGHVKEYEIGLSHYENYEGGEENRERERERERIA